jgi:hypothetical protein
MFIRNKITRAINETEWGSFLFPKTRVVWTKPIDRKVILDEIANYEHYMDDIEPIGTVKIGYTTLSTAYKPLRDFPDFKEQKALARQKDMFKYSIEMAVNLQRIVSNPEERIGDHYQNLKRKGSERLASLYRSNISSVIFTNRDHFGSQPALYNYFDKLCEMLAIEEIMFNRKQSYGKSEFLSQLTDYEINDKVYENIIINANEESSSFDDEFVYMGDKKVYYPKEDSWITRKGYGYIETLDDECDEIYF